MVDDDVPTFPFRRSSRTACAPPRPPSPRHSPLAPAGRCLRGRWCAMSKLIAQRAAAYIGDPGYARNWLKRMLQHAMRDAQSMNWEKLAIEYEALIPWPEDDHGDLT